MYHDSNVSEAFIDVLVKEIRAFEEICGEPKSKTNVKGTLLLRLSIDIEDITNVCDKLFRLSRLKVPQEQLKEYCINVSIIIQRNGECTIAKKSKSAIRSRENPETKPKGTHEDDSTKQNGSSQKRVTFHEPNPNQSERDDKAKNKEMKKIVALEAFSRIENGMIVYLDSGSTILTAISALRNKSDITIVTNSILVAYECANMNLNIIMAGGLLFNIGKRTYGHFATEIIDHLSIDLAIMGTDAFTEKSHGFTTISADELGFKRHVMNQSAKKIMISDASKVNNKADIAPYAFCKFNEFDEFITNHLTAEQYDVVKTVKKVTQV